MALDHANIFIAREHPTSEFWNRPLPYYPDALAFFTRFVTHLAAPGFFLLMGAGVSLYAAAARKRGVAAWRISLQLVLRGSLLIILQLLVENRAWSLSWPPAAQDNYPLYFGVLYGLGAAMIVSAALVHLRPLIVLVLSLGLALAIEPLLPVVSGPPAPPVWLRLGLAPGSTGNYQVYYPLLPWLAIGGLGLVYGRWLVTDRARALRAAWKIGLVCLALLVVVRVAGGYGNLRPVSGEGWLAFFNLVKYPPSLAFQLLTLGADLILLWIFARLSGRFGRFNHPTNPLLVFGRAPLFFYLAHLYLYAVMGMVFAPRGTGIPAMYPYWLAGLTVLYPLCWLYGRFKHSRPPNSFWRLF